MTNPLPTSPEVEAMECAVICSHGSPVYAAELHRLRAAQHAATRQAVLEEVLRTWQTVLVTAHDHDRFGRFLAQLQEAK